MKYIVIFSLLLSGCGYGNLDYIRGTSDFYAKKAGLEIVGYHGYEWGDVVPFTRYGGAKVWYTMKKPGSSIYYMGGFQRWGEEVHLYNLKAIDAISGD